MPRADSPPSPPLPPARPARSGWYVPRWENAALLQSGAGAGCSFVDKTQATYLAGAPSSLLYCPLASASELPRWSSRSVEDGRGRCCSTCPAPAPALPPRAHLRGPGQADEKAGSPRARPCLAPGLLLGTRRS
jgi:hypothetical protein